MALDQSALLELLDAMRSADGGELGGGDLFPWRACSQRRKADGFGWGLLE